MKTIGVICIVAAVVAFIVLACIGICKLFGGIGVTVFVAVILLIFGIACVNYGDDFNPFPYYDDDDDW